MPCSYAHYRFGVLSLPHLPANIRRVIQRNRQLFDVGLHGPDLFFYYHILSDTPIGALGEKYHRQTGREFFSRVCKRLRLKPSEPGEAYLYGVLAHYCLDSVCHPFVKEKTGDGMGHIELEVEFDRFLLEHDGNIPPNTQDFSSHMKLSPAQCAVAAQFYSPATAGDVARSVRTMALCTKALALSGGVLHSGVEKILGNAKPAISQQLMTKGPNPNCAHLDGELFDLYRQALAAYPEMVEQAAAHMAYGAPFGAEFDRSFG